MKQILIIILSTLIGFGLGKFGFSIGDRKVNGFMVWFLIVGILILWGCAEYRTSKL